MEKRYRLHKYICFLTISILVFSILLLGCSGDVLIDEGEEGEEEGEDVIPTPDIIFFNGQVITMDPDIPQSEALAVIGEDILAIGSNDEIQALSGPGTQIIDISGRGWTRTSVTISGVSTPN